MKSMKRFVVLVLSIVMIIGLVGCGNSNNNNSTSTPTATTAPAADSSSSDDADDTATEKEVVTLVYSNTEKPLTYEDEDGNILGYEWDILQAIEPLLENYSFEYVGTSPETCDVMMESGEAIVSVGGYYLTDSRKEAFAVPETPIGASSLRMYVRTDIADQINTLMDVSTLGLSFCPFTPNGGTYKSIVKWNEENGNVFTDIPTQEGTTSAEKVTSVSTGQYDVLVNPDNLGINETITELGLDVVVTGDPIVTNQTVVIVNKEYQELCDEINAALKTLTDNGFIAETSEKWYGYNLLDALDAE